MPQTFFFYDLETSGLNPRADRTMQFAGQRTDLDLNPIGDPVNLLIKLADDTLPSPYAIFTTGITPQKTQEDGLTEYEFCKFITKEVFTPGTITIGYNSIRFDDEFMRHLLWRNFYDSYEWQWKDGRSRWDLLDVVRITRALRPEGINWPSDKDGKATNRLELITKLNKISHNSAHDALSDVSATIAVAKLIKQKQPKLFNYLFKMRDKREVQKLVNFENPQPFVYTSGTLSSDHNKTSVFYPLAPSKNGNALVFDLRYDWEQAIFLDSPELRLGRSDAPRNGGRAERVQNDSLFPIIKELKYNRCPAVAPLSVLDQNNGWNKIGLSREQVDQNLRALIKNPTIAEQARTKEEEKPEFPPAPDPESALYDGFLDNADRVRCDAVRNAKPNDLADFHPEFIDPRLPELLIHYKARNFKNTLTQSEQKQWESYRQNRIQNQSEIFVKDLEELAATNQNTFLLEELYLWHQSLLP